MSGVLGRLLEYWMSLPRSGSSLIPGRTALQCSELLELMPRLALLKRLDRYNVQASMMNISNSTILQNPLLGMNAFDLTAPAIREQRASFYEAVLDKPAVAQMRETVRQQNGKEASVKSLYLPMADSRGEANYIIACTVYENRPEYNGINDRLVLDHQNVQDLSFIDIGGGVPTVTFERQAPEVIKLSEHRWWSRLVPVRRKADAPNRLNA